MRMEMLRAWTLVGFCSVLMRVSAVLGAPGDLDPTFGHGGMVTTNFGWGSTQSDGRAVLQQPDGKLVVAGSGWQGIPCFGLIRFASDGSVDTSFGDEGRVLTVMGSPIIYSFQNGIYGLVQQSDGKLVAAGRVETELGTQTTLVRYQADGSLDTTFGAGGIVRIAFTGIDEAHALALQDDGKLVVAGYRGFGDGDMLVARFNHDGSLDSAFGDGGTVSVGLAPTGSANAIVIQNDGALVVAGVEYVGPTNNGTGDSDYQVVLARFLANGTPDASFGTDGVVRTNPSNLGDSVSGLLQQDDGRLVVVGSIGRDLYSDVMLLRYDENGTLDPGFGSGGLVATQLGRTSGGAGVVQRPDGRLVVAAETLGPVNWELATVQYNEDGSLDSTFGNNGIAVADFGPDGTSPRAMLRQTDGKLLVAGDGGFLGGMALVRFESTGALDAGFGSGGMAAASASGSVDRAAAFVAQSDRKLVAFGTTQTWDFPAFALARYDADGRLDPTFGVGGKVITTVGNGYVAAGGVVQQSGGQLVVAGTVTIDSTMHIGLARYTSNGVLDPTFGNGGVLITTLGPGNEGAGPLLLQNDGKLLVVAGSGGDDVLLRYQPDGSLDLGFGNGGTLRFSDLGLGPLTQQADGKLVVGGSIAIDQFAIARFNLDGTFDPTFSGDGKASVGGLDLWDGAYFSDVLQQTDGKLVGAGDHYLMRFSAAGTLDNGFGVRGVTEEPITVRAASQLPDGTLVAGGNAISSEQIVRFALTHHNLDGTVDSSFGNGGMAQAMSDSVDSRVIDLHIQSGARIVAFGESDSDFALARFFGQSTSSTSTSSTSSTSSTTSTSTTSSTSSTTSTTSSSSTTTTTSTSSSSSSSTSSSSTVTTTVAATSSTTTTLGCPDTDADGICDPSDACVNVAHARDATRARLTARHLLPPSGDDALSIAGTITLSAAIDPVTTGIRFLYGDQAGDIRDVRVPPGAYDPATRTGWTAQGAGYRYANGDGSLDLIKVVLRGSTSVPGQYKVKMKGKDGTYAASASPVHAVLVLAPPFTGGGQCGEWRFPALPPAMPSCAASPSGDVLKCR